MWRDKLERLARAHRDDDEAARFRNVPDQERARMFASLCRMALAALRDRRVEQEERPASAQRWWEELVRRERAKSRSRDG